MVGKRSGGEGKCRSGGALVWFGLVSFAWRCGDRIGIVLLGETVWGWYTPGAW
jgi:hypothetical protein